MSSRDLILAIDQGTTGSRALVMDCAGAAVGESYVEVDQILPRPGWVEHDALAIWRGVMQVVQQAVAGRWSRIAAIGITNQRETAVIWSRATGLPIANAIVWQDRRTAERCAQLAPRAEFIRDATGLELDAYFTATKAEWMLQQSPAARADAHSGHLALGTIDSWLAWNLTAGRAHITDFTNASRTMLFDIHQRAWRPDLLETFGLPRSLLPSVVPPCLREVSPASSPELTGGHAIPIGGMAGDQQAALFGQRAFSPGQAKNTYGTGAFLLMNTGRERCASRHRLLTTLACDQHGDWAYALEGSIFVAGAAIQWLRDQLGAIDSAAQSDALARSLASNDGVYFIPALAGLGAPHWRSDVRGALFGLTRGSGKAHLVRAALEAMAYQSREVIDAMQADSGVRLTELMCDGGASRNDWLMQFQADLLGVPTQRAASAEMTATGAAFLAGLSAGLWPSAASLPAAQAAAKRFEPGDAASAANDYSEWQAHLRKLLA